METESWITPTTTITTKLWDRDTGERDKGAPKDSIAELQTAVKKIWGDGDEIVAFGAAGEGDAGKNGGSGAGKGATENGDALWARTEKNTE